MRDMGFIVFIAIVTISAIAGFVSSRYMGDDNPVEETAEWILEEAIETGFELPRDSINIDLSPSSRERD